MSNHNRIVVIRIVASTMLAIIALAAGVGMTITGLEVPAGWWVVTVLAVGGVVGAEVVGALMRRKGGGDP
ncbi:unnamed protein product [marine sediment metagenome]|uniref:Uncharacterized protein n=1 Tax=marine sediment metagenome TaxID=412755 RepID=X1KVJ2_9ZZZZ